MGIPMQVYHLWRVGQGKGSLAYQHWGGQWAQWALTAGWAALPLIPWSSSIRVMQSKWRELEEEKNTENQSLKGVEIWKYDQPTYLLTGVGCRDA